MTLINVNTLCQVDDSNPTPVKGQEIEINITAVDEKDYFQNFVLGIDNFAQCCEDYGTFSDEIPNRLYVKTIETEPSLDRLDGGHLESILPFGVTPNEAVVYRLTTIGGKQYYFGVYNVHNGYYTHCIYENGKEITYL